MKAIAINRYGGPEVLEHTELDDPKVGPDGVLVRVRTAGVNPVDWKIREGYLDGSFPSHFPLIPGWDVAGTVEATGPAVTEFAPGDNVVGYVRKDHIQNGTYAELVTAPVRALARAPVRGSWAEAAGLPLAGLTAQQVLQATRLSSGEVLLVHAASGGVGSLAVQLGRIMGARVIGTASEANHDYLRSLGAEPVTYGAGLVERVRDLVTGGVDVAVDFVGGDALEVTPQLMRHPGRFASVIDASRVIELGGHYVFVRPDAEHLARLVRYVDEGQLNVEVPRTLPLEQAAEAHRLNQQGHTRGKLVLDVS